MNERILKRTLTTINVCLYLPQNINLMELNNGQLTTLFRNGHFAPSPSYKTDAVRTVSKKKREIEVHLHFVGLWNLRRNPRLDNSGRIFHKYFHTDWTIPQEYPLVPPTTSSSHTSPILRPRQGSKHSGFSIC